MTMISISLLSCKKEEIKNCNCGKIINAYNESSYMSSNLDVKNYCSGNKKKFKNNHSGTGWLLPWELDALEGKEHCSNQPW
jgi:hypothetical protein